MATDNHFFRDFFTEIQAGISDFIDVAVLAFNDYLAPIIKTGCTIYIVLYGFSIAFGKIKEPYADSIFRNIKVAIILGLTIASGSGGFYETYVSGPAQSFPEEVSAMFLPDAVVDGGGAVNVLDTAFNAGWDSGQRFFNEGGFSNFGFYFIALGIWAATLLFTIYAAFLFLLSKIALAVLLSLGPLFIALALFDQTKRFTESWIAQVINYALIPVIAAAILGLTITFFTAHATVTGVSELGANQAVNMVIIAFLSWVVLKQAPAIASGLAGGASLNGQGAFGFVGNAARAGSRAAGAAFNRTAIGRELQVRRAERQSTIQREGRSRGIDREKRQTESASRRRDAFASAGASAGRMTGQGLRAARSGVTSGLERVGRLRERLARRP